VNNALIVDLFNMRNTNYVLCSISVGHAMGVSLRTKCQAALNVCRVC